MPPTCPSSELVAEREYPKHSPQKMVQVALNDMIAAIPPQPPQPQEAISPENSTPRSQNINFPSTKTKKGGSRGKERPGFSVRGRQAMGRGTREGLEGHGSSPPTNRASRILRYWKGCHQGLQTLTVTPDLRSWGLLTQGPFQFSAAPNICLHNRPQARPLGHQARS